MGMIDFVWPSILTISITTMSGQPLDAPKMWVECGVTLQERRGALLSRFYDQRDTGTLVAIVVVP